MPHTAELVHSDARPCEAANARDRSQVLRIAKKGMFNPNAASPYGDIIVRIEIDIPSAAKADISKPADNKTPLLRREEVAQPALQGCISGVSERASAGS